jgi:hypothetical protein
MYLKEASTCPSCDAVLSPSKTEAVYRDHNITISHLNKGPVYVGHYAAIVHDHSRERERLVRLGTLSPSLV